MVRSKSLYFCNACGGQTLKWQGQCPHCREWNTLVEAVAEKTGYTSFDKNSFRLIPATMLSQVHNLNEIETQEFPRYSTGMIEFDRVLGGG